LNPEIPEFFDLDQEDDDTKESSYEPSQDHEEDLIAFDRSENDTTFDHIIGCIEDIVISDEFQDIQVCFNCICMQ